MQLHQLLQNLAGYNRAQRTNPFEYPHRTEADRSDRIGRHKPVEKCDDCREKADSYMPSSADSTVTTPETPPADAGLQQQPDGTYYQREARLDYSLNLRFDLSALVAAAAEIESGEVDLEEFAAAGFGLHTDFAASGYQTVSTNQVEQSDQQGRAAITRSAVQLARSRSRSGMAGLFASQDRAFAVQGFTSESSAIRRSLHESVKDGHRRATNRIALRFQSDSQFQFSFLQRFNVQTQQVAEKAPDAVGGYVDSAGKIAGGGSVDMMQTFFDTVDAYLAESETQIREQASAFFEQAAAELGFDGELVDMAREQLLGSIDSFFDRVGSAVDSLDTMFTGGDTAEPAPEVAASDLRDSLAEA